MGRHGSTPVSPNASHDTPGVPSPCHIAAASHRQFALLPCPMLPRCLPSSCCAEPSKAPCANLPSWAEGSYRAGTYRPARRRPGGEGRIRRPEPYPLRQRRMSSSSARSPATRRSKVRADPGRRSIRAAVNFRSFRCGASGWGGDLSLGPRGGSPGCLPGGEPTGLCRCLDGVIVALFWARPAAGRGAGRRPAGRTVRLGRGWAGVGWLDQVRTRSRLSRRARRTRPRRAARR
jgi:hypothetical protein